MTYKKLLKPELANGMECCFIPLLFILIQDNVAIVVNPANRNTVAWFGSFWAYLFKRGRGYMTGWRVRWWLLFFKTVCLIYSILQIWSSINIVSRKLVGEVYRIGKVWLVFYYWPQRRSSQLRAQWYLLNERTMIIISFLPSDFPFWSVGFKPVTASPPCLGIAVIWKRHA